MLHKQASKDMKPVQPQDRLSLWTQDYLGMFLLGIICIIIGSLGARSVKRKQLTQPEPNSSNQNESATDFAVLLQAIADHIQKLYQHMHHELTQDEQALNSEWLQEIEQVQKLFTGLPNV